MSKRLYPALCSPVHRRYVDTAKLRLAQREASLRFATVRRFFDSSWAYATI